MTATYNDTLKTGRLQLMSDLVAGKTFTASTGSATAGQLVIGNAALAGSTGVLATIPLATPAPFTISGSGTVIATLVGVPLSANATATGTGAKAELRNNTGTTVVSGLSVGILNTDIVLASVSINNGQLVTVISGVITHG
jgi:hypothetical protein